MRRADLTDLRASLGLEGLRAATAIWLVVNAVNVLQSVGFATRPFAAWVNPVLGLVIAALAIPATWALLVFLRVGAGWRFTAGPVVFDAFVILMLLVEHVFRIPWRDPAIPAIQVPYLVLFFGAIFLMGVPMDRIDRRRWLVTVATTVLLLAAMVYATLMGVG
jgi:hypothetical protein